MEPQHRADSRWASPWGEFLYRGALFLRVVALLTGVVMAGLVLVHLVCDGWAQYLMQACVEAGVFLLVGILLQLVVLVCNRAVRPQPAGGRRNAPGRERGRPGACLWARDLVEPGRIEDRLLSGSGTVALSPDRALCFVQLVRELVGQLRGSGEVVSQAVASVACRPSAQAQITMMHRTSLGSRI